MRVSRYNPAPTERALRLLKQERFDLILADIKMPRMSGTDLLFQIRDLGLDTKVILMTAYASLETAVQALRGDASDYLVKPFSEGATTAGTSRAGNTKPDFAVARGSTPGPGSGP